MPARWALALILALTVLLLLGAKESATFNLVMTLVHLVLMVFIIIAGLTKVMQRSGLVT